MKYLSLLIRCLACVALLAAAEAGAAGGASSNGPFYGAAGGGGGAHPTDTTLALDDDVQLQLGTDTDAWFEWDTATTPDQLSLNNTDCDGGGTDCVIFYTEAGSPNLFLRNGEFIQNETDGYITLGGSGGTNNENLQFDFETTANTAFVRSTTGVSDFRLAGMSVYIDTTQAYKIGTNVRLLGTANGRLRIDDGSVGATLDVATADTVVVKDLAGTGNGNLKVTGTLSGLNDEFISNATDGKITLGGSGGTNNEDLVLDFETNGNQVTFTSTTGVSIFNLNAFTLAAGNMYSAAAGYIGWTGRSAFFSPATGQFKLVTWTSSSGATLDVDDAADTIVVKDQAGTGNGNLTVTGLSTLTGGAVLPVQTAATPSAPATCDASAKGRIEVVDDSDDGAGTQVCYCGMTDDTTYDWLNLTSGAACTFY